MLYTQVHIHTVEGSESKGREDAANYVYLFICRQSGERERGGGNRVGGDIAGEPLHLILPVSSEEAVEGSLSALPAWPCLAAPSVSESMEVEIWDGERVRVRLRTRMWTYCGRKEKKHAEQQCSMCYKNHMVPTRTDVLIGDLAMTALSLWSSSGTLWRGCCRPPFHSLLSLHPLLSLP